MDKGGFYIGHNDFGPVFVNFFRRDNERVNSNMMIIGKSGSGKSFATKTLLANLAADNSKIFILDPENEYDILTENLKGQAIDVGTGMQGRINPFHITPSLQGEGATMVDDYSSHLQFLEQFFRVILSGISSDAFEKVNTLVVDMYTRKGINQGTDINRLKPEDFPVFDDLYNIIDEKVVAEKDEYLRRMYQIIETYIQKFSTGGRNSNLWNGATTLETKENFVTFSFRSLLANNNMVIANAQMLLVLRYLNNEIIKNKEFNTVMGFGEEDPNRRKVIITVDEAHVFINKDYPIALNFMEQMAKRIRKYSGMQIIITQNIKDFVGSEEIAKQSAAVINASQYSMIFGLSPNDMSDLVALYRNAGGINEDEQDNIATAGRGQAFLITSPISRTNVSIIALPPVRQLFEKRKIDKDEDDE
jgi:type IV secretory pathway VirB4 component